MALTNWDLITIINTIRNKNLSGEDIRADEYQSLFNSQSQLMFAEKLGLPNLYQANAPIERRGAEVSRKISQELKPFLRRESVLAVGGAIDLSSKNIGYFLACEPSSLSGRGMDELNPSEVADRLSDPIVAPTESDPAFEWSSDSTILIYPSTITNVVLRYYEYPSDCVIATTYNATTLLEEYDAGSSTELEWSDEQKIEIAYRVLRDIGINMERTDVAQYAQQIVTNE